MQHSTQCLGILGASWTAVLFAASHISPWRGRPHMCAHLDIFATRLHACGVLMYVPLERHDCST
jgi:hypothetical protein